MSYLFINHTDWERIEVIICCFEFILCCLYDEMVNKCVATKCKYNYDSERRKRNEQPVEERTGIFEFPSHQHQPECRRRWIARVPRKDWKPRVDQKIFICEDQFRPIDIVRESKDSNPRRKRKRDTQNLQRKRYSDDAIPCIWPQAPAHLSSPTPSRSTSRTSSESRNENFMRYQEDIENARIEKDTCRSLDELYEICDQLVFPQGVLREKTDGYILFYKLCTDEIPKIVYSIRIDSNMLVTVYLNEIKLKNSLIRTLSPSNLNTISAINEIFTHLQSQIQGLENTLTDQDIIDDIIDRLSNPRFEGNTKIGFIGFIVDF